jgi:hypothetical protein
LAWKSAIRGRGQARAEILEHPILGSRPSCRHVRFALHQKLQHTQRVSMALVDFDVLDEALAAPR